MKLVAVLAAAAAATAVEATGLVGTTCSYGTTPPPLPPVDCELYTLISDPSPWGACALDTASGKYVRTKVLGIKTPAANGGKACPAEDDPIRRVQEVCQAIDCVPLAPADDTGPFGPCKDDGTGAWYKSKVLGIKEPAKNGGKCDEKDRTIKELCKGVPCVVNLPTEDTGNFSDCRINPANPTQWIKTKTLGIKTPAENGGSCPSEAERQYSEVCPAEKCIPLTPEEDTGPYGECTKDATTGKWVKSKVLGIKTPAKYGGSCDEKDRTFTQPCAAIDCVWFTPEEDKGPFGNCTDDGTGKWYKSKVLGIKIPAQYGGTECVPESQRTVKELCPAENCIPVDPADDLKPFGNCTDDGTGKWYKSKVLDVKVPAKNGGSCDEKNRTIYQLCEPVPCVVNLPSEDTGDFTPCALDTTSYGVRYIKTKILGIKTHALNGGSCPSEAERKYTEVCPPENCIPLTPEEDTGPYGDCMKDATTGKWVKSKILGIKVEAKYGGTCDEKDRTFTQPCAAIDCVWFTPEEDKGPFGNCTDDGTGKWYKSKVLGIKTPAQYGGTDCVPESQRTVKELCPAENCVAVDPADDTKPFGNCTDDGTGKWYKSKVLDIKVPAKNGGSCDEKNCTVSQFCEPVPCVVNLPSEDTGDFTPCALDPETYGVRYIKTKILGIKTPAQNGGSCPSEAERKYTEVCPPVNCVPLTPEEDKGPFGNCTDDGTGKYYKSKVLGIKVPAQNGGLCDEKNRTITEFCPPLNCVALDPKDDTKPFGNCTNDGTGKYYKSKVLGIKTPAQNGGTCDEKNRTITEFCPPKNCVALSPAEDKGPFGNCTQEGYSAKYYKTKTLGIKYPAENGGTCDPADRQYKLLCDPINCVVNTPAEDKGEFGDCKKASDGKYYKSKVLGIKVPAQYGGSCPSEKDRTVTKECLNDGYCLPWDPFYDTCLVKLAQCGAKKNGVVYVGSTINVVKGLALWECCDKCTTTAGCVAYTYIPFGNAAKSECWLKWDIDVKLPVYDNTVSSSTLAPRPRQCSYFDDRTLVSFTSKTLAKYDSDDLDFCCAKCKANAKCKAFTVSDDTCYLESEEGVRVWWPGTRAGWTRLV